MLLKYHTDVFDQMYINMECIKYPFVDTIGCIWMNSNYLIFETNDIEEYNTKLSKERYEKVTIKEAKMYRQIKQLEKI